jgi:demethylmenaquinone methyltransferase/2-methoxy-6-polyprenyl-1,4-benzoquinol methylase
MYKLSERNKNIRDMFTTISEQYDFLNHFLSLNIDKSWRKKAVKMMDLSKETDVLDLATGTADVAIEVMKQSKDKVNIVGVDFSHKMLKIGVDKVNKKNVPHSFYCVNSPVESLPIKSDRFDYCTIAFGIRNVPDKVMALKEMVRVLKPNGKAIILELTKPENVVIKAGYGLYFSYILPIIGGFFSKKFAYSYLPDSVGKFPSNKDFIDMMRQSGFKNVAVKRLTLGVASIYSGEV